LNRFHLGLGGEALSEERIEALKGISDAARDRAIDLVIGLEDPSAEEVMRLLAECEAVRGVYVDAETAAFASGPVSTAGRYVVLETTKAVKTAVPVPMRVAVEAGEAVPVCDGPCSTYMVFEAGERAPARVAGADLSYWVRRARDGWRWGTRSRRWRRRRRGGGLFAKSKRVI
jgi:hypothetical protein